MKVIKQSSLQQMLFTEEGFKIVENEEELKARIEFAKGLFKYKPYKNSEFSGWTFRKKNNVFSNEIIEGCGFTCINSGIIREYCFNYCKGDLNIPYKEITQETLPRVQKALGLKYITKKIPLTSDNFYLYPFRKQIKFPYFTMKLYFKTEGDMYEGLKLINKYDKQIKGYTDISSFFLVDENTFITPKLQINPMRKESFERFYLTIDFLQDEKGNIKTYLKDLTEEPCIWVSSVFFFVDDYKITLYIENVEEDKIGVKKEKVEV